MQISSGQDESLAARERRRFHYERNYDGARARYYARRATTMLTLAAAALSLIGLLIIRWIKGQLLIAERYEGAGHEVQRFWPAVAPKLLINCHFPVGLVAPRKRS